jgi:hypothetical protein
MKTEMGRMFGPAGSRTNGYSPKSQVMVAVAKNKNQRWDHLLKEKYEKGRKEQILIRMKTTLKRSPI